MMGWGKSLGLVLTIVLAVTLTMSGTSGASEHYPVLYTNPSDIVIGAGDAGQIHAHDNVELAQSLPFRLEIKISAPLVHDPQATDFVVRDGTLGKT